MLQVNNMAPNYSLDFQVEQLADDRTDLECPVRFRLQPLLK